MGANDLAVDAPENPNKQTNKDSKQKILLGRSKSARDVSVTAAAIARGWLPGRSWLLPVATSPLLPLPARPRPLKDVAMGAGGGACGRGRR